MRDYFVTLGQVTAIGLAILVLNEIGFDTVGAAAVRIFPNLTSVLTFLAVMAGLSLALFFFTKKRSG